MLLNRVNHKIFWRKLVGSGHGAGPHSMDACGWQEHDTVIKCCGTGPGLLLLSLPTNWPISRIMFGLLSLVPKHQFFGVFGRAGIGSAWQGGANCQYQWWWTTIFWWRGVTYPMTDPWCCYIWCSMDPINKNPSHVSIYIYISYMDPSWDMVACQCCSDRSVIFLRQVTAGLQRGDDVPSPPEVLWLWRNIGSYSEIYRKTIGKWLFNGT